MKFRVPDLSAVRKAVEAAGGRFVGAVLQTDCYFDTPRLSLLRQDRGLRLRTQEPLHGRSGILARQAGPGRGVVSGRYARPTEIAGAAITAMVTYKGPRRARGRAKSRREIQTTVADPRAVGDMLEELGLTRRLVIQKRRCTWRLGRCLVELDELPILGAFVEIEGASPRAIESAARRLGLAGPPLKAHYVQLVTEACGRVGNKCLEVTFARCGRGCGSRACGRSIARISPRAPAAKTTRPRRRNGSR